MKKTQIGLLGLGLVLAACGGGSGSGDKLEMAGVARSVLDRSPQPNRSFVVNDLARPADQQKVAEGVSDAVGRFAAKVGADSTNLIIAFPPVEGQPRTSGLISLLESSSIEKDLNDVTDLACVAGASALGEGQFSPVDLNRRRIANLEAGARRVLDTQAVDFNDPDSFNSGVAAVRDLTDDGAASVFQGTARSVRDNAPQAGRDFVIVDLALPAGSDPIASGTSDALGVFLAKMTGNPNSLIISFPQAEGSDEPRVSGLVSLRENTPVNKTLNNVTDLACVAGAGAIGDGSIPVESLNANRIANLEAGAQQVLSTQSVDFEDADSFNAAVAQVRQLTNDGANPPQGS